MRIPFAQIDAFADAPFTGNPAAVMPLSAWLDDATLQAIASENNLSETAFLIPADGDADFELRWFTPAAEVALCGHATLASGHFVLSSDTTRHAVRFRTRQAGVLEVARHGAAYEMGCRRGRRSSSRAPTTRGSTSIARTAWPWTGAATSSMPARRGISMRPAGSAIGPKDKRCSTA